ncbi:MAG: hypothetical protein AAGL29_00525 [Bacteroidota bacterium]
MKEYLINILNQYAKLAKEDEIRAFKIMFYGNIQICFLTNQTSEYDLENNGSAIGWKLLNFEYDKPTDLHTFFKGNKPDVFDAPGESFGSGYRKIAAEVLHETDLVEAFVQFKLSSDFEYLIYNEFNQPDCYNFYTRSYRESKIPMFTKETFKERLKNYLIEELQKFANNIKETEFSAFDLSIFPWYGYIYFSFITKESSDRVDCYAENWNFFNFNDYQFTAPEYIQDLSHWMQRTDFDIFNTENETVEGEGYFKICGELLHDQNVLEAFELYKKSPHFEFYVFNNDEPTRDDSTNYYLKVISNT